MTLTDKIKSALHGNSGKHNTAGSNNPEGAVNTSGHAVDPQTGPDAYQPLTKNAEAGDSFASSGQGQAVQSSGHGQGVQSSGQGQGLQSSRQEQGVQSSGRGQAVHSSGQGQGVQSSGYGQGVQSSGQEQGVQSSRYNDAGSHGSGAARQSTVSGGSSAGAGGNDPTVFKQNYSEDVPGYASEYGSGKPVYTESVQEGKDGSYNAQLGASADNKNFAQARELTLAAEREAATAKVHGERAGQELSAAEKAEQAVHAAQIKHREALQEAEKYRGIVSEPGLKEQDLADAQQLHSTRQQRADESARDLQQAEADLAAKQRDVEGLSPQVNKYGQTLPGLEESLAAKQQARAGAEDEHQNLLAGVQQAEGNRAAHARDLEALERQQQQAEHAAAIKQQEYTEARNAAQNAAQQVADLKAHLRNLDNELLGHRGRAEEAEQNLPAYREAEQRAARELENSQSEWYRLKQMEEEYSRNYAAANDRYQQAHSNHGPASRELQDTHSALQARQDDLDRARSRASAAERKYRDLLALADRHKQYGDSAAQAAQTHGQNYEHLKQEAEIHGDKHVEYWNAARQYGDKGSSTATDTVHKLEEKVKDLMSKHEP